MSEPSITQLDQLFAGLATQVPIAMLPVRLETRWFEVDQNLELRIRIYPDAVHVDDHQPLTVGERDVGLGLWTAVYEAMQAGSEGYATVTALWQGHIARFGYRRAHWIAVMTAPLNLGTNEPPQLPEVEAVANDTRETPTAQCLPSRWQVIGYDRRGGRLFTHETGAVAQPLALGPDPNIDDDPDELLDAGTRWLTDFEAAEAAAMAVRIELSQRDAGRLERILVVGVRDETPAEGAVALSELLDTHQATEGLEFIQPGTPTNNSNVARANQRDDNLSTLHIQSEQPTALEGGASLVGALGLESLDLRSTKSAYDDHNRGAQAINTAIWPGTWGYYLNHILQRPGSQAAARRHFIDHVRGLDVLPTLRIRNQPYGMLPVTSLDRYRGSSDDSRLIGLLQQLRDVWRRAVPGVPHLGQSEDVQRNLVEVLSMSPTMTTLRGRLARGADLLHNAWTLMGKINSSFDWVIDRASSIENAHAHIIGLGHTRLAGLVYDDHAMELDITWSARADHPNTFYPTLPRYLSKICDLNDNTDLARLRAHHALAGASPRTLLYYVVRQGFMSEFVDVADAVLGDASPFPDQQWSYGEKGSRADLEAMIDRLDVNVRQTLLSHYAGQTDDPNYARLIEFKQALQVLRNLTAEPLDRLTSSAFDLCSHRLDAWINSFANKRLGELREATPTGVHIGAYGWAIDVEPPLVAATAGGSPDLDPDSAGFIHAPSLAQARTASVLLGGYRSRADGDADDVLALDLSSARVRGARWLLDGVRSGQTLGELLGHRFERRLAEKGAARLVLGFRALLPHVGDRGQQTPELVEAQVTVDVTDGLALVERWRAGNLTYNPLPTPDGLPDIAPLTSDEVDDVEAALRELDDALDATSDLLMAEGVHQTVNGNRPRAGAAFEALSQGDAPAPDPEVCQTPSESVQVTHRVAVLLPVPTEDALPNRPRSGAAPRLHRWATSLLGSLAAIKFRVRWEDGQGNAASQEFTLAGLDLDALDLVYLSAPRDPGASLDDVLLAAVREDLPENALHPTLDSTRATEWSLSVQSLDEARTLARSLYQVLEQARPLEPRDLALHGQALPAPTLAVVEDLEARAGRATQYLADAASALANDPQGGVAAWWKAVVLLGPIDPYAPGVREVLARNLAARQPPPRDTQQPLAARYEQALAAIKLVLGRDFVTVPLFTLGDSGPLAQTFDDQSTLLGDDPEQLGEWIHDYARARSALEPLDTCLTLSEAIRGAPSLVVGHLPPTPDTPWIGNSVDTEANGPRLSLVVHQPVKTNLAGELCGLFIDAWTENVPRRTTTTGMVFNYDAPRARAPQAMLLAVHPEPSRPWSFLDIEAVLRETLELAALRCVEPGSLGELAQLGPITHIVNKTDDVPASDIRTVATHLVYPAT